MELDIVEATENEVIVQFLTPVDQAGVLEICSLAVVSVGANLPCLTKRSIDDVTTMR